MMKKVSVFAVLMVLLVSALAFAGSVQLPRTGQDASYAPRDDGDLQKGIEWPDPRFTDHGDGTVTDNLTVLMWTKNAGTPTVDACTGGTKTWNNAIAYVACLNSISHLGHSDWRLSNINELESLVDAKNHNFSLPTGHPFIALPYAQWSSTTCAYPNEYAWAACFYDSYCGSSGYINRRAKSDTYNVWPVRGGQ
jgi:hypothetical protein